MKRAPAGLVFAVGFGLLSPLASAQTPPSRALPPTTPRWRRRRRRSWPCRKQPARLAQEALVWLGLYVGVNDGDFGKRHARRDPCLSGEPQSAGRRGAVARLSSRRLLAAAQKAREAAGFQDVSDPKTGAKIGAPLKLLNVRFQARGSTSPRTPTPTWAPSIRVCPRRRRAARLPIRRSSRTPSLSSRDRTDRSSSTPASTRTRTRTRQSAASPSPIRRRKPPISTALRSPSPIHSSRSRSPPPGAALANAAAPSTPSPPPAPPAVPRLPRPRLSWRPVRR